MLNTPFKPWPSFTKREANKIQEILLSNKVNYWTGNQGKLFEDKFSQFSNANYSVAVANGTVALDLALIALQVKKGDEVIVTPRSYVASASAIRNSGAKPIFVDVDYNSQNISPIKIEEKITKKTKAIICVHFAGWPCEMDHIKKIADKYNLKIIEDCAQAHGALYKGNPIGALGDIGAWSFCQDKIITTGGEGGMVTCNNKDYWKKIWSFKDHGKSLDEINKLKEKNIKNTSFKFIHNSIGTNWRLTEIQSALGLIQLDYIKKWNKKRTENAKNIIQAAKKNNIFRTPIIPKHITHAFYKLYLFVNGGSKLRDELLYKINNQGVPCYTGGCSEIYREKAFGSYKKGYLKTAAELGDTSLMFLVHPTLTKNEINKTCEVINSIK